MFCRNCGTANPNGSKFCGNCGAQLESLQTFNSTSLAQEVISSNNSLGTVLGSFKRLSKYIGEPFAANSESSGTLYIYDNRLEFIKKMGAAIGVGGLVGIIGLGISAVAARMDSAEIYEFEQISEVRRGKYMGIYNTLVVVLKNGDIYSFCPAIPGSSDPKKIIDLVKPYM